MNRLHALTDHGQAIWLDFIRRDMLLNGELRRLVEEDRVTGVTSNPAIFRKAIAGSDDYDEELGRLILEHPDQGAKELYESLAIEDIQRAADLLQPVYDRTGGADGYVSLEVSPHLARDRAGTVDEARRLWSAVDRPNLMIKVPATREGIPAIEELLAAGINVNVTLMFSMAHYEAVAGAYLRGLSRAADPSAVASVASFFVSRVDSKVDAALEALGSDFALALRGKIGIANSKAAYRRFREIFHGSDFASLRARGARPQRVLWASTSTKNPAYRDVLYVEELVGPETVNTIPPATLDAFRDHGEARPSLAEGWEEAAGNLRDLAEVGIDFAEATEALQREGLEKFSQPFDDLLTALETKREALVSAPAG